MNNIKELYINGDMTMNYLNQRRKGQSAIEYLTTYGWMLLVVAIVGGAIFTTVQGQSNIQNSSGLANADVQIANFGVTGDGLTIELRSAAQEQVENLNVTVGVQDNSSNQSNSTITVIPVGDTKSVSFDDFQSGETQNTYDVNINYDTGGLENLEVSGTLTGRISYVG